MNKKLLAISALMLAVTVSIGFSAKVSAESMMAHMDLHAGPNISTSVNANIGMRDMSTNHGVFGTVTAINGSTVTVSSKNWTKDDKNPTSATYTINTTSTTKVDKNRVASSVSAIAVGDSIMAEGTVNGSVVTATVIHDGVMAKGAIPKPGINGNPAMQGNGQPIIGGKVTAVSGNTVTITNNSNASYTIDATNAKITKAGSTAAVSNIAVGDEVLAQGTINGNTVTAVTINDGAKSSSNGSTTTHVGFFGKIGGFFAHLFGF